MSIRDERFKQITSGLLDELAKEEMNLEEADSQLMMAKARYDVAVYKYAAVRDMVMDILGTSPYIREHGKLKHFIGNSFFELGKYRFINMSPGKATVLALQEVNEPLTLQEIVDRLYEGNIDVGKDKLTRTVNAALMRTEGVIKTDDGKYTYRQPEEEGEIIDIEALPADR